MTGHRPTEGADDARRELHWVPPQGLTLAQVAEDRRSDGGRAAAWHLRVAGEETPQLAGFHVGIAYGTWGLSGDLAGHLGKLAGALTNHVQDTARASEMSVMAVLSPDTATVAVLPHTDLPMREIPHPWNVRAVRELSDTCGFRPLGAAGPSVYATVTLADPTAHIALTELDYREPELPMSSLPTPPPEQEPPPLPVRTPGRTLSTEPSPPRGTVQVHLDGEPLGLKFTQWPMPPKRAAHKPGAQQ